MRHSNHSGDAEFPESLSAELRELDRELSGIRIEERPSFAPELEGELVRKWLEEPETEAPRPRGWVRTLMAACLACLAVSGVAVPSARAGVVRLIRAVVEEAFPSRQMATPVPEPQTPQIQVQDSIPADPSPGETGVIPAEGRADRERARPSGSAAAEMVVTFPELRWRGEAERLLSLRYPVALQAAGVGGSVKLMFWVNESGLPENIQVGEGSGYVSLNRAAMRAAQELRFRPATRNGVPVGTWVELEVHFVPGSGAGLGDAGPAGSDRLGGG